MPVRGQIPPTLPASKKVDLTTAAQDTYAKLKDVFQQDRNYWRLGQTFVTANARHVMEYPSIMDRSVDATMVTLTNDGVRAGRSATAFGQESPGVRRKRLADFRVSLTMADQGATA